MPSMKQPGSGHTVTTLSQFGCCHSLCEENRSWRSWRLLWLTGVITELWSHSALVMWLPLRRRTRRRNNELLNLGGLSSMLQRKWQNWIDSFHSLGLSWIVMQTGSVRACSRPRWSNSASVWRIHAGDVGLLFMCWSQMKHRLFFLEAVVQVWIWIDLDPDFMVCIHLLVSVKSLKVIFQDFIRKLNDFFNFPGELVTNFQVLHLCFGHIFPMCCSLDVLSSSALWECCRD